MEQTELPQHIRINSETYDKELTPNEILVYANLKMHMNKDTLEAFPSQDVLKRETGLSKPTIKSCLDRLEMAGEIEIGRKGRHHTYKFNPQSRHFEMYSFDFLKDQDLTSEQRAFLIVAQRHMYKDVPNVGKLSLSNAELADKLNVSESSIYRRNVELEHKGILTTVPTRNETGSEIFLRIYDLSKVHQEFVTVKQQVAENTEDIAKLKETVARQEKLIQSLLNKKSESEHEFIM